MENNDLEKFLNWCFESGCSEVPEMISFALVLVQELSLYYPLESPCTLNVRIVTITIIVTVFTAYLFW